MRISPITKNQFLTNVANPFNHIWPSFENPSVRPTQAPGVFAFPTGSEPGGASDQLGKLLAQLKDKDPEVRANAACSLGELGDKRAVEPLIQCLKDEVSEVRAGVALSLGELKDIKKMKEL